MRLTAYSDRMRALAMFAIVAIHAVLPISQLPVDIAFTQAFKFADAVFIFISAYLWALKRPSTTRWRYLGDRAWSLLPAYAIWLLITFGAYILFFAFSPRRSASAGQAVSDLFLNSPFWFIPSLLLHLFVIDVLWFRLGKRWSGVAALAITIFFGVDRYLGVLDLPHGLAPVGFLFFAWLGYWFRTHEQMTARTVSRISLLWCVVFVLVAYSVALVEQGILNSLDSLRLSNTLYGFAVLLLVVRMMMVMPAYREKVKGQSYGVYLSHAALLIVLPAPLLFAFDNATRFSWEVAPWLQLTLRFTYVLAVWMLCIGFVRMAHMLGLGWLVGRPLQKPWAPAPSIDEDACQTEGSTAPR